jgi:hypothetical protein
LGVNSDATIWQDTLLEFPPKLWELILADGIYIGEDNLLVKYPADQSTSIERRFLNAVVDLYRARVEHIMHEVLLCVLLLLPCNVLRTVS